MCSHSKPSPHLVMLSLQDPSHLHLGLPSGLLPSGFPTSKLYPLLFDHHSCYMPCQFHPQRLDHSNYTWRRVQITKLFVMQLSPLHPFSVQIFSEPYSSLNIRYHVSNQFRIICKIIVLYIIIFTFFDSTREDRMFWTEW
jgi:hypothetical protein